MAELTEGPHGATVEHVQIGDGVDAVVARPDGEVRGHVALAPDIGGLRPLFDDICRRLATHGLAVCAPEPFARIPAGERAGLDLPARMGRVPALSDAEVLGNLAAAADLLDEDLGEAPSYVLGFCMGGYFTLKAAATGRYEKAVAFYGMVRTPTMWAGPGLAHPVDTAAAACPTLAIFGTADQWTPPEDIDALRAAWSGRADCEVVVYEGAEHGFVHDPSRPAHRPDDAADVWGRVLRFLL
jgi:carboxymethylenebutenolidase